MTAASLRKPREFRLDTRCEACKGHAEIVRGRTRVNHAPMCPIYQRLLTYSRFSRTLALYRSNPN